MLCCYGSNGAMLLTLINSRQCKDYSDSGILIDTTQETEVGSVLIEGPCPWCQWFLVLVLSGLLVLRKKEQ